MIDRIGRTAGKLWETLSARDEAEITALPRLVNEKALVVNQALGWLAREGKLEYRTRGNRDFVALAGSERRLGV